MTLSIYRVAIVLVLSTSATFLETDGSAATEPSQGRVGLADRTDFAPVDAADMRHLFSQWGAGGMGDLTGDALIDAADVGISLSRWSADPVATPGSVAAEYITSTGEIRVAVNDVVNWYIESASAGLTGTSVRDALGSGLITDHDRRIGETSLTNLNYSLSLGRVAAADLAPGDLTLYWNPALGQRLQSAPVAYPPIFIRASDYDFLDRVTVEWSAIDGAESYQLFRGLSPEVTEAQLLIDGLTSTTAVDTTAVPGVTYHYWSRVITSGGPGSFGIPDLGTVAGLPAAPQMVQASDRFIGDGIQVTWGRTTGAKQYAVWRNSIDSLETAQQIAAELTDLTYVDLHVPTDQSYYYWVVASNVAGNGPFSLPDLVNRNPDGPFAGEGTAAADYNSATGVIRVTANSVVNWYVQSVSGGLTGVNVGDLPGPGLVTDNDRRIGETALGKFSYTVNLGRVAAIGLPCGDLTIYWNSDLGIPLQNAPMCLLPEPTSMIGGVAWLAAAIGSLRRAARRPATAQRRSPHRTSAWI